jgi:hypothetical protein
MPSRQTSNKTMDLINQTPPNIQQLVADANRNNSWKIRLAALEELRKYDCQQSRDVITRLALHDKVYKIKEEAFRAAQALGITKSGVPIRLGKKDIGFKPSDFTKVFQRIKREQAMDELDLSKFKSALQNINPEMLDVMSFEKGSKLDSWIESIYKCLPKK